MKAALSLLALAFATSTALAAEPVKTTPRAELNALFRVLKKDGSTVIGQVPISTSTASGPLPLIKVNAADALVAANGRCAFNVKYDEVSSVAATGTTNRLYSNDALIAQNSAVDLQAGVLKTVWTQPYLVAGTNNIRIVLNATSATPVTGWVRVEVAGSCNATPATPPVVVIAPGSADWNRLYAAWGYSNYATKQLQGKGYARYAELSAVNAALTTAVNARRIEQPAFASLMARWDALSNDAAFKAAMAKVVPTPDRP